MALYLLRSRKQQTQRFSQGATLLKSRFFYKVWVSRSGGGMGASLFFRSTAALSKCHVCLYKNLCHNHNLSYSVVLSLLDLELVPLSFLKCSCLGAFWASGSIQKLPVIAVVLPCFVREVHESTTAVWLAGLTLIKGSCPLCPESPFGTAQSLTSENSMWINTVLFWLRNISGRYEAVSLQHTNEFRPFF